MGSARPQVRYWALAVRALWVEFTQLGTDKFSHRVTPTLQLLREPVPVPRYVLEHYLVKEYGNGIKVRCECVGTHTKCLEWNRAAPRKWIHHEGPRPRLAAQGLVRDLDEALRSI